MRNSPQRPTPLEVARTSQRRSLYAMFIQIAIQLDIPVHRFSHHSGASSVGRRARRKCGGRSLPVAYGESFLRQERVILQFNTVQTPRFPGFRQMLPFTICSGCSFMPSTPVSTLAPAFANIQPALRQAGRQLVGTHLQPALTCQLGCTLITGKSWPRLMRCSVLSWAVCSPTPATLRNPGPYIRKADPAPHRHAVRAGTNTQTDNIGLAHRC